MPFKRLRLYRLREAMREAGTYEQWQAAAIAHDEASGAAAWKEEEQTRIYDHAAIRTRLDQLREHRAHGDDHGLLFALNEGIHGNMGYMGRAELYARAMSGTKRLITEYLEEIAAALLHLAETPLEGVSAAEKLDFFRRASLCFGRSALLLSGGGIYGNFHVGVAKTLIEQDLLPGTISGASSGALIAAILGTHTREELGEAFAVRHLLIHTRAAADAPRARLFPRFELEDVRKHIERLVPDLTFAEAHARTGLYINISVSPAEVHQTPRLMNAITSPNVYLRSAVLASCAVPGIYPPVQMMAKNYHGEAQVYLPGRRWRDGSVSDDVPARRLSRLYAVNHYIVSQVNPFALLNRPLQHPANAVQDLQQFLHHASRNAARMMQSVVDKYGRRWPDLRQALNGLASVWMQDYGGDINILPPAGLVRPWKGMATPTESQLAEIIRAGERAAWPRIEMIRNCTMIGRVLDGILAQLESGAMQDPPTVARVDRMRWMRAPVAQAARTR